MNLELRAGGLRLALRPDLGAAVAGLWLGDVEVLRSTEAAALTASRLSGCYPLVPWSNRISGGGIETGGRFWPLQPNWPGEPYPIHGDGWRRPWQVARHTADLIELTELLK